MGKRIKSFVFYGVVLAAAFLTACGMSNKEKLARAEKILQVKYGTEFTGDRFIQQKFMKDYYRVTAYPTENPDLIITADVDTKSDEASSDYMARLFTTRISDQIYQLADGTGTDIYVEIGILSDLHSIRDPDITPEELITLLPEERISVNIYGSFKNDEERERLAEEILPKIAEIVSPMNGFLRVYQANVNQMEELTRFFRTHDPFYERPETILLSGALEYRIPYADSYSNK